MEAEIRAVYDRAVWSGSLCPFFKYLHDRSFDCKFLVSQPSALLAGAADFMLQLFSDVFQKYPGAFPGE